MFSYISPLSLKKKLPQHRLDGRIFSTAKYQRRRSSYFFPRWCVSKVKVLTLHDRAVSMDQALSLDQHVKCLARSCLYRRGNIDKLRPIVPWAEVMIRHWRLFPPDQVLQKVSCYTNPDVFTLAYHQIENPVQDCCNPVSNPAWIPAYIQQQDSDEGLQIICLFAVFLLFCEACCDIHF